MTVRVYCHTCEGMVHPTDPHSCFSAAAHREYREAEAAVIEAAKAQESELHRLLELGVNERPDAHTCLEFARSKSGIKEAVRTLRALEEDA